MISFDGKSPGGLGSRCGLSYVRRVRARSQTKLHVLIRVRFTPRGGLFCICICVKSINLTWLDMARRLVGYGRDVAVFSAIFCRVPLLLLLPYAPSEMLSESPATTIGSGRASSAHENMTRSTYEQRANYERDLPRKLRVALSEIHTKTAIHVLGGYICVRH